MKVAVSIIAHNEEKNIAKCLRSILNQSRKADEIVLVCHNCNDRTEKIAKQFSEVKVINYQGLEGIIWARKKVYESLSSDIEIVASTDGDCVATPCWLEKLVEPLENNPEISATGGAVFFTNSLWANLMSLSFFYTSPRFRRKYIFYFWGASSAFRLVDYRRSGGLDELIDLKGKLNLFYWAEDLFLALKLRQFGKVHYVSGATMWTKSPKLGMRGWLRRTSVQNSDRLKLFRHFGV